MRSFLEHAVGISEEADQFVEDFLAGSYTFLRARRNIALD